MCFGIDTYNAAQDLASIQHKLSIVYHIMKGSDRSSKAINYAIFAFKAFVRKMWRTVSSSGKIIIKITECGQIPASEPIR